MSNHPYTFYHSNWFTICLSFCPSVCPAQVSLYLCWVYTLQICENFVVNFGPTVSWILNPVEIESYRFIFTVTCHIAFHIEENSFPLLMLFEKWKIYFRTLKGYRKFWKFFKLPPSHIDFLAKIKPLHSNKILFLRSFDENYTRQWFDI